MDTLNVEFKKATVSATVPDWSREYYRPFTWEPSKALIRSIRDYQRAASSRSLLSPLRKRWAVLRHRFWSVVTASEIPVSVKIGGGLLLPHPTGVVIHGEAIIGPNCLIFQNVTIGAARDNIPTIGGHVDLGAGAKILGPITIGDHVKVGANSVVLEDVPAGCTAVGVPARVLRPTPKLSIVG